MFSESPISFNDLSAIDATNLPHIEKHHIRLLAHCLECFKQIAKKESLAYLPDKASQVKWCLKQPLLANDEEFMAALLEQFDSAFKQLEKLAIKKEISPLELTINDLIQNVSQENDQD